MMAQSLVRRPSYEGSAGPFLKILIGTVVAVALLVAAFTLIPQETWDEGYALATTGRVGVRVSEAPKHAPATFTYLWVTCMPDPGNPGNSFLNFSDSKAPFSLKVNRPCSSLDPKGHNGRRKPEHNQSLMCSVLQAASKEFAKDDPRASIIIATAYQLGCK